MAQKLSTSSKQELLDLLAVSTFDKLFVLTDSNVGTAVYPSYASFLPGHVLIVVPAGEESKSLASLEYIINRLSENHASRKSLIINLGGGMITDLGGFAAATYMRGINYINIPTTLLAMVDAASGGKTGVNLGAAKNLIGAFHHPIQTFFDVADLASLSESHLLQGWAEIMKHCLIADADVWEKLQREDLLNTSNLLYYIQHSQKIKEEVTTKDPKEQGLRKILNFGHTIGHAIEGFFLETKANKINHGQAVAAGCLMETFLSQKRLGLPTKDLENIQSFILKHFPKVEIQSAQVKEIAKLSHADKKNNFGKIITVGLMQIAEPIIDFELSINDVEEALHYYLSLTQ